MIKKTLLSFLLLLSATILCAQGEMLSTLGNNTVPTGNRPNGASRDTTKNKQIPRGITVWTVDEVTGERESAIPDTTAFMRMNHALATGVYGDYTTLGNNGSPRLSRIFIDRERDDDFIFINGYSQVLQRPGQFHFTNTFSPITNLVYNSCGNKINGEDHLKATFAVNASKQLGFGFRFNYLYARGYYANQNLAHFGYSMWGSYIGDRYSLHMLIGLNHHKQSENGGITNDEYVTHPESFSDNFSSNEIPTILSSNWNRQDNQSLFLTQGYNVGFYRKVPMTPQEIEAKKFAEASKKEKEEREAKEARRKEGRDENEEASSVTLGRPKDAKIMGDEPAQEKKATERIKEGTEAADSIAATEKGKEDDEFMKDEYVPVTRFFHTLSLAHYQRAYVAYETPKNFYLNDFYDLHTDSIDDLTRHTHIRNALGMSLLEGFNKWAKAGIHLYASHDLRHYALRNSDGTFTTWNESDISIGGGISKKEGKTLHFNANAEISLVGDNAGQTDINGKVDVNIPLLGDTATIDARGSFSILSPSAYLMRYASRHFKWDVYDTFDNETRTHLEGNIFMRKTDSRIRVALDNLTNYTYLAQTYNVDTEYNVTGFNVTPRQSADIQVITAQLFQNVKFGIFHWDNIVTYQKSTNEKALPLPRLNVYSNLFIRFKIAGVLATDFGVDARYFTKYYAPEYCPQMLSFAIQENDEIRKEVGNYPLCNVYANFQLKTCRFYIMMSHVNCSGKGDYFFTPHYPMNGRVLRIGLNWNFYN